MKILMTADAVGGVWTYALSLVRALPQHHYTVVVMGPRPSARQRSDAAHLPNLELVETDWILEWMDGAESELALSNSWLLDLEQRVRPDLIHLNSYAHGALPFKAPVALVAHSCVLSWWRAVKGEDAPARYRCYGEAVREGLRGADAVVSPTRAFLQDLRTIYGEFGETVIIHNGHFHSEAESVPNPSHRKPFVAAAGRLWDEAKNMRLLETIAPKLSWPIHVAGAIQLGDHAADPKHPDGTGRRLKMMGHLTRSGMDELLAEAAVWAHPARYEPFGLSTLEAATAGCPLVLSDLPTHRELWDGAAHFAAPDKPAEWTHLINQLATSPAQRTNWAAKARQRSRDFTMSRCGSAYHDLYGRLA